ncbi:MAG: NAD(P)H-hydrate epimerase [Elusimicrobia bacterium]|nr:NAD(P)H-hydrate epimerase [Candidatus Liberimonas magnetica]
MITVTSRQMRSIDATAINKYGIPAGILMENAGIETAKDIIKTRKYISKPVAVFCGSGNNGGDGLVVARHLFNNNFNVEIFLAKPAVAFKTDSLINYNSAKKLGIKIRKYSKAIDLSKYGLIVDALLGTGTKGEITGIHKEIIEKINLSKKPVISIDIPSGLDADSGKTLGAAVKALKTITIGFVKKGLVTKAAKPYVGKLTVAGIGLPRLAELEGLI